MRRTRLLFLVGVCLFLTEAVHAQWQVTTLVPGRAGIEDGMVRDQAGNLYVSQYDGTTVRKVTPSGDVSVYAQGFSAPNGLAIDDSGVLYVANANGGRVSKVYPDGTVVSRFIGGLTNPVGLALNATQDTLYIAHYQQSRISRVALADSGNVETWVTGAPLNGPVGLVFADDGNLYAGNFNNGQLIRITPQGAMSRLATIPSFMGFVAHVEGVFYATSFSTHRVYRIDLEGNVSVFAGTGSPGQQNGEALNATFNGPNGIVASATGDTLYVSDYNAESLRMITNVTQTGVWESDVELPASPLQLDPNFPNPFSGSTIIPYYLAHRSAVNLYISTLQGRRVRAFSLPPHLGIQQVVWDGRDEAGLPVPNGVYFYTTDTGTTRVTRKLMVMR